MDCEVIPGETDGDICDVSSVNKYYSIPVMYIHPNDDLLRVLFGDDIPCTDDVDNPYFIACTRTPLGFNMDPIYSDVYALA